MHLTQFAQITVCSEANGRSARRRIVSLSAQALDASGEVLDVHLEDLSEEGCRVRGGFELEQATTIWVKIPGLLPRKARIVWSEPGVAGCEFEARLSEVLVDQIREGRRSAARGKLRALADHFTSDRSRALVRDVRGATAIEYGLIVSLIVIAVVGGMSAVASRTVGMWGNVSNTVSGTSS